MTLPAKIFLPGGKALLTASIGSGGKVIINAEECCCDDCVCPELADTIHIDLSGMWAGGGPCWFGYACTPVVTGLDLANSSGETGCQFSSPDDLGPPGGVCVGGYSISNIQLSLASTLDGDCFWEFVIEFHDSDGVGGATEVTYRQRTPTASDPTGVYDFFSDGGLGCPTAFPASITAS